MSILCDYIETQAKAKKEPPQEWLKQIVENTATCRCVTHVGKFTDSGIDSSISIHHKGKQILPIHGYLCTDSVGFGANLMQSGEQSKDSFKFKLYGQDMVVSSASFISTPKFMTLQLEDGRTVLEHVNANSDYIDDLGKYTDDLEKTKSQLKQVIPISLPEKTSGKIRQVYFPVDEDYHLISPLTSSIVLFELKSRLKHMEQSVKDTTNPKNHSGEGHGIVLDLTAAGFGGAKPQNVSLVNLYQNHVLLLSSCPPVITAREITVPHSNFFSDTLRFRQFKDEFYQLHKIFMEDKNNVKIRNLRKEWTADIIDKVLTQVYVLREIEPGWTERETCRLPPSQKIWLDDKRLDERNSDDTWLTEVSAEFARWFFNTYEKLLKEDRIIMGQEELRTITQEIAEVLRCDRG